MLLAKRPAVQKPKTDTTTKRLSWSNINMQTACSSAHTCRDRQLSFFPVFGSGASCSRNRGACRKNGHRGVESNLHKPTLLQPHAAGQGERVVVRQEGRCQNAQQDAETCKSQRGKSETEKEARARQRQEDSGERKPPKNLPTLLTSFFTFST